MKANKISIFPKSAIILLLTANGYISAQRNNSRSADPIAFPDIHKKSETDGKKIQNIKGAATISDNSPLSPHPIYIINGERIKNLNGIDESKIKSMRVYKDQKAIELYGEEGKNGVIVIEAEKDYLKKETKAISKDVEILAI